MRTDAEKQYDAALLLSIENASYIYGREVTLLDLAIPIYGRSYLERFASPARVRPLAVRLWQRGYIAFNERTGGISITADGETFMKSQRVSA